MVLAFHIMVIWVYTVLKWINGFRTCNVKYTTPKIEKKGSEHIALH